MSNEVVETIRGAIKDTFTELGLDCNEYRLDAIVLATFVALVRERYLEHLILHQDGSITVDLTDVTPDVQIVTEGTVMWIPAHLADMTEGKGGHVPDMRMGVYVSEQEAWDAINARGGVMGRHPLAFDHGIWQGVGNWQELQKKQGWPGDWTVVSTVFGRTKQ